MKYIKKFEENQDKSLVTKLILSHEDLTKLPDLSEYTNLRELHCNNNELTYLPELPKKLEKLYCYSNQLTYLPELPKTLTYLHCNINKLTYLPELPHTIQRLFCSDNELTYLPELPDTFISANFRNNKLPFDNYTGYKKWYEENKHIIDKVGLKETYELLQNTNKYNL